MPHSFHNLAVNTFISAGAFFVVAIVPLLLIPVIVDEYGLAQYGYLVLVRLFLPTGALSIFDFGNSEIATYYVVKANHDNNWQVVSRNLCGLISFTFFLGVLIGAVIYFSKVFLADAFDVTVTEEAGFTQILSATAVAFPFLLCTLVLEGILKGFESFKLLRSMEVLAIIFYGAMVLLAVALDLPFYYIGLAYLTSLICRSILILLAVFSKVRHKAFKFGLPDQSVWHDMRVRLKNLGVNRLLGASQSHLAPLLIGNLLGAAAVAVYDLIIRFPRFLKLLTGLMNTAVLPVSSRFDAMNDEKSMQVLGEKGLFWIIIAVLPVCVWGAIFSPTILEIWIDKAFSEYWMWQSILFVLPFINALTSFGCGALLNRPAFVLRLNVIVTCQVVAQFGIGIALIDLFQERGFIVGQAIAVLLSFPFQMWLVGKEQKLVLTNFKRHFGVVFLVLLVSVVPFLLGVPAVVDNLLLLAVSGGVWCFVCYALIWLLFLRREEKNILLMYLRVK